MEAGFNAGCMSGVAKIRASVTPDLRNLEGPSEGRLDQK